MIPTTIHDLAKPQISVEISARFWSKVQKSDGCWLWLGTMGTHGYGQFFIYGKNADAHRISFCLAKGEIPAGLQLDHLCRNRRCVNPAHLEPVTNKENVLRGVGPTARNAAKTHCVHGHPLSGDNLVVVEIPGGLRRRCMTCRREHWRKENARRQRVRTARRTGGVA